MDDLRDARRRWLALVCDGPDHPVLRRRGSLARSGFRRHGGRDWHSRVLEIEAGHGQEASMRDRAVVLGEAAAARSVLFPIRSYDYGVCGECAADAFLS